MLIDIDFPDGSTGSAVYGRLELEDWNEFLRAGCSFLTLNASLGWDGTLGELPAIGSACGRGLHILPLERGFDVSQLQSIRGISYLYLGEGCKGELDLAWFEGLVEIRLMCKPKKFKLLISGACGLKKLSSIGAHIRDPGALSLLRNLRELELIRPSFHASALPEDLALDALEAYGWTKLHDLDSIARFRLGSLRLSTCRRIQDYSALQHMTSLESLYLDDCSHVPSAKLVCELPRLKSLTMRGTEFVDKDISCLAGMGLEKLNLSGRGYFGSACA